VVLPPFVPQDVVADMVAEARRLTRSANRARVPFVRTAGAISHATIVEQAPALSALRSSPAFLSLCRALVGQDLVHRRSDDPHASALYSYTRAGDHVGWHRDDCGCVPNASFTVVLGLVEDCTSRLEFDLHRDDPSRATERLIVPAPPGAIVLFCGSKAWHRVTPLNRGGERLTYSFVYLKRGHDPKGARHLVQAGIDTLLYFGARSLVRRIVGSLRR
jgi:hypothetical protein